VFTLFFIALQFVRFDHTNPASDPNLEIDAPKEVKAILEKSCFDCHSNETAWPWYSNIAPLSWIIYKDVKDAREWINFSEWESYNETKKQKYKKLIYREIASAMPMYLYVIGHPKAELDEKEKDTIRQWCGINALEVNIRD
jgi:Haem-binding domain